MYKVSPAESAINQHRSHGRYRDYNTIVYNRNDVSLLQYEYGGSDVK